MNNIDAHTNLLGLIGFPIHHSLSPLIHNYLFQTANINSTYVCFTVEPKQCKLAIQGAKALGLRGLNVTIPHKETVIPYLDSIDKDAKAIGAVNTITINKGKAKGFNTDGPGFVAALHRHGISLKTSNVLILGAGGAARAVGAYIAKENPAQIQVYDIDQDRAHNVVKRLKSYYPKPTIKMITSKRDLDLSSINLLVNATGVGLHAKDRPPISLNGACASMVVYDLIYNPAEPVLLQEAKRHKLQTINGLWMLIYQALYADSLWFNQDFLPYADKVYRYVQRLTIKTREKE